MGKKKQYYTVHDREKKTILADRCLVADHFFSRLKGLIGKKILSPGDGLLITPCNDIHMWFMSVSIDVIFLWENQCDPLQNCYRVSSYAKDLTPWKLLPVRDPKAQATLELPSGTVNRCNVQRGDWLCIS